MAANFRPHFRTEETLPSARHEEAGCAELGSVPGRTPPDAGNGRIPGEPQAGILQGFADLLQATSSFEEELFKPPRLPRSRHPQGHRRKLSRAGLALRPIRFQTDRLSTRLAVPARSGSSSRLDLNANGSQG